MEVFPRAGLLYKCIYSLSHTGMNCCACTAGTYKSYLQAWGFVYLFVLSCWAHRNPLAMAGCRSSAPLDSTAQVQLVSSSLAQSRCPTHPSLPVMPLEHRTSSAEAHLVHAPRSCPRPAHGGNSAGTERRKRPRCSTTNRLPAPPHRDTNFNHVYSETTAARCRQENPAPWNIETPIIY